MVTHQMIKVELRQMPSPSEEVSTFCFQSEEIEALVWCHLDLARFLLSVLGQLGN